MHGQVVNYFTEQINYFTIFMRYLMITQNKSVSKKILESYAKRTLRTGYTFFGINVYTKTRS